MYITTVTLGYPCTTTSYVFTSGVVVVSRCPKVVPKVVPFRCKHQSYFVRPLLRYSTCSLEGVHLEGIWVPTPKSPLLDPILEGVLRGCMVGYRPSYVV